MSRAFTSGARNLPQKIFVALANASRRLKTGFAQNDVL
jgi:hypothetical protein